MANIEHIKILCLGVDAWNTYRAGNDVIPDLTHIEVRRANFQGADMRAADFDGSTLSTVDFRHANLQNARLNGVNVSRSCFENANLQSVELKGSDFKRVSFRNANLRGAEAFELKIRHSDLRYAALDDSRLRFIHIYNSDLRDAHLNNETLEFAVLKRTVVEESRISELKQAGFALELTNQPTPSEWLDWPHFNVRDTDGEFGIIIHQGKTYWISEGRWDFFISHASSVKETIARPLAHALQKRDQKVWFDELQIKAGDILNEVIELGIKGSLFGVVVITEDFFGRRWTEAELDVLTQKRIFLVLHNVQAEDLRRLRPGLEDRFSIESDLGAEQIADKLIESIQQPPRHI
jgi:hypothetical protein